MNVAANDSARVSGQDRKIPPALGTNQIAGFGGFLPLTSLEKKKKNYWMRFFLISEIISSNPQPSAPLITLTVACVASVSARVCRESWDESKKKRNDVGRGGERRKRLPANPTILKNCVRPRTQLLISAVLVVLIT